MVALQTWRSQRARESIITYRYELTPDTTWYLSMRLHLLWGDASVSNDICYAISVRFIFPTLTCTSHGLYFHIGGRKDFLFSQCWNLNPEPAEYWASVLPLSYILKPLGVSMDEWVHRTLPCSLPGKSGNRNDSCHAATRTTSQDCSMQTSVVFKLWVRPWGSQRKGNSWLRRQTTDLTNQTCPANLHISFATETNSSICKGCN